MVEVFAFLFGYAAEKLLDRAYFSRSLSAELQKVATGWAKVLPTGFEVEAASLLKPITRDEITDRSACTFIERLQSTLHQGLIPTVEVWESALLEQWNNRKVELGLEAQPFFLREEQEVAPHLESLARALRNTCISDQNLFQQQMVHGNDEVLARLEALRTRDDQHSTALTDFIDAHHTYCLHFPYATFYEHLVGGLPPSLDEVFVPLPLTTSKPLPTSSPLTLAQVMERLVRPAARPMVILGEPGTGKSTLLRRIGAYACTHPEKIGLPKPHLPLLLRLRWLSLVEGASIERKILNAIHRGGELLLEVDPPIGFFSDWPGRAEMPWLLLLDGLDEVPRSEISTLVQWLQHLFVLCSRRGHHVILTSRPFRSTEMLEQHAEFLRLETFKGDELEQLAHRWFADKANEFLAAVADIPSQASTRTPLLTSIAAAIFRKDGLLPGRRSDLFDRYVDISFSEAERQGMRDELDPRVLKLARSAVERIALEFAENFEESTLETNSACVSRFFEQVLRVSKIEARADGERFVEVIGRRSGIMVVQGEAYTWIHPSFGEYLAACELARRAGPSQGDISTLFNRWGDPEWREILSYLLAIWDSHGLDISQVLGTLLTNDAEAAFFVAPLAQEVSLSDEAITLIVEQLTALAKVGRGDPWTGRTAVQALEDLARVEGDETLERLVRHPETRNSVCAEAVSALLRRGAIETALRLLDSVRIWSEHFSATEKYIRLYMTASLRGGWLERLFARIEEIASLAGSGPAKHYARGFLARVLLRSFSVPESELTTAQQAELQVRLNEIRLYLRANIDSGNLPLSAPSKIDIPTTEDVCLLAISHQCYRILIYIATDSTAEIKTRHLAIRGLFQLQRTQEAVEFIMAATESEYDSQSAPEFSNLLKEIAQDKAQSRSVRLEAVRALVHLKLPEALVLLAGDPEATPTLQEDAIRGLAHLGAHDCLVAWAHSPDATPWLRYCAARSLAECSAPDAAAAITAVQNDERLPAWIRTHVAGG